jgi:hypothetical protein
MLLLGTQLRQCQLHTRSRHHAPLAAFAWQTAAAGHISSATHGTWRVERDASRDASSSWVLAASCSVTSKTRHIDTVWARPDPMLVTATCRAQHTIYADVFACTLLLASVAAPCQPAQHTCMPYHSPEAAISTPVSWTTRCVMACRGTGTQQRGGGGHRGCFTIKE